MFGGLYSIEEHEAQEFIPVLLPETQQLIAEVQRNTRKRVVIKADPSIRNRGRAMYVVSEQSPDRHLIVYDPAESHHVDHLIAHEVGHIWQYSRAGPDARRLPVVRDEHVRAAMADLDDDLVRLRNMGLAWPSINRSVRAWVNATVAQLCFYPADACVERWLFAEHPGLRKAQERSIEAQVMNLHGALAPQVATYTPKKIVNVSNVLNCCFVQSLPDPLIRPSMLAPYQGTSYEQRAQELVSLMTGETTMLDLRSAFASADRWAATLNITRWFEWGAIDDCPPDQGPSSGKAIEANAAFIAVGDMLGIWGWGG